MVIIDRYIRRALLTGVFVSMAVLLPLVGFLLLADELDNVGVGRYTLADAFIILGLSMPRYAHRIFPIGGLIGCLLGLGALANHGELNAMRAVGVSVSRIVWSILKAGMIAALFAVFLGEIVAPWSEEQARVLRSELLSDSTVSKTFYGFWARDGNTFINIRDILPDGRLKNLYIYEFDKTRRLTRSTHAVSAIYSEESKIWTLENVDRSIISETRVKVSHLSKLNWPSLISPSTLSLLVVDPHVLPIWELNRYIQFMEANGLSATSYSVIFWGKVATPIVILVMMALAVPLLFGNMRRVNMGQRVFVGVLIGTAFYVLDTISSQLAVVFGVPPLLAAFLPSIICFSGVLWGLRYQH